jgi:ABC-type multidrug transport system ATPase subunit
MIRVEGITKRYGPVLALDAVHFEVERGETFGIIGPNGAGKSTILKILLGLVHADRGSLSINGLTLARDPIAVRGQIGYVPQKDGFEDRSTGREMLGFLARLRKVSPSRIDTYAGQVGVEHLLNRDVGTLSGGQRQKLSLAAALIGDPPVLLLDEPTASLDPQATADFRKLVERLAAEGRTIVLCSHLLTDVEKLCGRVLILLEGRVAALETIGDDLPRDLFVDVEDPSTLGDVLARFGSRIRMLNGSGLRATLEDGDKLRLLVALAEEGITVRSFETKRPSLEERFLETVGNKPDWGGS